VVRNGVISDGFWELVESVMPSHGAQGRPHADHRLMLEGIAWRFRTGCPWRDLPVEFGPWQTVWKRHHRFSFDGTYQRMFDLVRERCGVEVEDGVAQLLSVDSTVMRAHQHAAGAPKTPGRDVEIVSGHTGG
jgi:transposase